jgi:hypothetical protein
LVAVFLVLSGLLLAVSLTTWYSRAQINERLAVPLAGLGLLWTGAAVVALVEVLAAYHYGVLHHDCPWCLLLPEHRGVGFVCYTALLVVFVESACIPVLSGIRRQERSLSHAVTERIRSAAGRVVLACVLFEVLSLAPPLIWRLRFGVWMG